MVPRNNQSSTSSPIPSSSHSSSALSSSSPSLDGTNNGNNNNNIGSGNNENPPSRSPSGSPPWLTEPPVPRLPEPMTREMRELAAVERHHERLEIWRHTMDVQTRVANTLDPDIRGSLRRDRVSMIMGATDEASGHHYHQYHRSHDPHVEASAAKMAASGGSGYADPGFVAAAGEDPPRKKARHNYENGTKGDKDDNGEDGPTVNVGGVPRQASFAMVGQRSTYAYVRGHGHVLEPRQGQGPGQGWGWSRGQGRGHGRGQAHGRGNGN